MVKTGLACLMLVALILSMGCSSGASDVSDQGALDKYKEIDKQTKDSEKEPGKAESRE